MPPAAVRKFFVKHGIEPCPILAAVSGGTDSTALLLALDAIRGEGFKVTAAHVNHHLRGAESDSDEGFVRTLCEELGIPLHVCDGTLDPERVRAAGIEAAAREIRYRRLQEIRSRCGAAWIATAHQKDDQAETVVIRLLTGSGVRGLRGIHPLREDGVIRPLLEVNRKELESFVVSHGVTPREDLSNLDPRFLRNRVRTLVRETGATDALAAAATQAQSVWPLLERAIDEADRLHVESFPAEARFRSWPDDPWLRQALLHRHVRRLDPGSREVGARDLERLAGELPQIARTSVTGRLDLLAEDGQLVLRRLPSRREEPAPLDFDIRLSVGEPAFVPVAGLTIHLARVSDGAPVSGSGRQRIQLPPGDEGEFRVRNRRSGDRFQPLGLAQPKKLKDFLIDRKIDAALRDRLPLLVWNGEIVWVAGVEVAERFKVHGPPASEVARYEVWMEGSGATIHRDPTGLQQ